MSLEVPSSGGFTVALPADKEHPRTCVSVVNPDVTITDEILDPLSLAAIMAAENDDELNIYSAIAVRFAYEHESSHCRQERALPLSSKDFPLVKEWEEESIADGIAARRLLDTSSDQIRARRFLQQLALTRLALMAKGQIEHWSSEQIEAALAGRKAAKRKFSEDSFRALDEAAFASRKVGLAAYPAEAARAWQESIEKSGMLGLPNGKDMAKALEFLSMAKLKLAAHHSWHRESRNEISTTRPTGF
ncbi:MAG: hypothetical protein NTX56_20375 [Proteobacteria bacterium]|nr:hypothetical protein [Pseudomonadota bacterium]